MKRIRREYFGDILAGRGSYVNAGGEVIENIFEEVASSDRVRVLYKCYYKMQIGTIHRLDLTGGEIVFALRLLDGMNTTNSLSFEDVENSFSIQYIREVRSSLKKAGVVDRLKLGSAFRWYFNPLLACKSKTVDKRLTDHFKGRLKYK